MSDKALSFQELKSSRLLGREFFDEEVDTVTRREIDELVTLLEMARASTLVILVCNPPVLRKKILDVLKERLSDFDVGVYDVSVTKEDEHVVKLLIRVKQSRKFREYEKKYRSVVLSVMGTENIFKANDKLKISRFYQNLNLYRDYFIRSKYPALLWVNEAIASDMTIKAPDFWRARTKVAVFRLREEMVAKGIMQISELPAFYRDLADIKRRVKIHERLLKSLDPNRPPDRISYTTLSFNLAKLKGAQGLYDEAEELYKKGLELAGEINDKRLISAFLHQIGLVKQHRGDYNSALKLYQQSLKIKTELGDKHSIAITLHQLAMVEDERGNHDKAKELYQKNLKVFKKLGDKSAIAGTLHQLAMVEDERGNHDRAEKLYQQSLKIETELGNKSGIARTLGQLAMVEVRRGNYDRAEKLYQQSLKIETELGDKHSIAITLHQLAIVEVRRGNYDKAEKLFQRGLNISRELGDKYGIAVAMGALGVFLREMGRLEDALKCSLEAAYILHELGLPREKQALQDMATTAKKLGMEKVNEILQEAQEEAKRYLKQLTQEKITND